MTAPECPSGTDRLAEVASRLAWSDDVVVVNVQGDEPLIEPSLIDACARLLGEHADCVMSTVAHPIHDIADYLNPNVVKVVLDARSRALLFSRAPLPWWRDGSAAGSPALPQQPPALRHVGLYAYRAGFLRRFPTLAQAPLERTEALEQLRVMWHGERIVVHVTEQAPGPGVDTPQDLERVRKLYAQAR
jgi:3-deoxy-manno-octulosonate cytidylyltransferase (CMP-KDO synthetase)